MTIADYRIAAGYNVALGSLVNIETITATGDTRKFYAPQAYGHSSPGALAYRLDGTGYRRGFLRVDWIFPAATRNQYEYLSTTYCSGLLTGQCTIYTRVGKSTYARYNAVMQLPATDEADGAFFAFKNLRVAFTHLVAI